MNYTFNKKLVEQLRNGEICAEFNQKKDSPEMLRALCKEAWPKDSSIPVGDCNFYFSDPDIQYWHAWNKTDKTPIPLSNFVQPEQSERDVMAELDRLIKRFDDIEIEFKKLYSFYTGKSSENLIQKIELSDAAKLVGEPEPKWTPKVGEWFKVEFGGLYYCTISDENGVFGDNQNGGRVSCGHDHVFIKPTDKEVEDYMVGLAKEKGYKVGIQIKTIVDWHEPMNVEIDSHNNAGFHFSLNLLKNRLTLNGFAIWYPDTGWAEIVNPVRWRSEKGKEYWYVECDLTERSAIEFNDSFNRMHYNCGNYFQTAQQAKEMALLMQFTLNNPDKAKKLMNDEEAI